MSELAAIVFLCVALCLTWLSTRQWRWPVRVAILLAGGSALAASAWLIANAANPSAAMNIAGSLTTPQVRAALASNWQIVTDAVWPLLLLFVLLASGLIVVAGIALTPGEAIERISRPMIASLFGALGGAALALSAVALGFGGYLKPRTYIFLGHDAERVDGDTFRVGDVPLRIEGIDALELDQACIGERPDCGLAAADRLIALMGREIVVCSRAESVSRSMPPEESFGRPLVRCEVLTPSGNFDLGGQMIEERLAVPYLDADEHEAGTFQFSAGCSVFPRDWRQMNSRAQQAFAEAGICQLNSDNPR